MNQSKKLDAAHPLLGLWLTRRCLVGDDIDPFKSVMDCEQEEAERIALRTHKAFIEGDYIEQRRKAEEELRRQAHALGLRPNQKPPLYFRLYRQQLERSKRGWLVINLPAECVPTDWISFTIEDSLRQFTAQDKTNVKVYDIRGLTAFIGKKGFPEHLDGRHGDRYIECQVWTQDLPIFAKARTLMKVREGKGGIFTITPGDL